MDENTTNVELEEESVEMVDEGDTSKMDNDELKKAIEEQMTKLRRQSMLLGAQSMCQVILQKIYTTLSKPGKKTYRDYERLIADIRKFCETGISRKVNADGTTSPVEENTEAEQ
ncbi:MAG: hypothetical protein ACI4DK_07190 [Lachnospiraceae bacterium]